MEKLRGEAEKETDRPSQVVTKFFLLPVPMMGETVYESGSGWQMGLQ